MNLLGTYSEFARQGLPEHAAVGWIETPLEAGDRYPDGALWITSFAYEGPIGYAKAGARIWVRFNQGFRIAHQWDDPMNDIVVFGSSRPRLAVPLGLEADAIVDPTDVEPAHHGATRFWFDPVNSRPANGVLVGICGDGWRRRGQDGEWSPAWIDRNLRIDIHPAVVDPKTGASHSVIRGMKGAGVQNKAEPWAALPGAGAYPHSTTVAQMEYHAGPLFNFGQPFRREQAKYFESWWRREVRDKERLPSKGEQ